MLQLHFHLCHKVDVMFGGLSEDREPHRQQQRLREGGEATQMSLLLAVTCY